MLRERLLVGGPSGAGKTYGFCKIVETLAGGHHAAIEVDDGWTKILQLEFPDLPATIMDFDGSIWVPRSDVSRGTDLRVYHCSEFGHVRKAQMEIEGMVARGEATSNDWACIDGLDLIYNNQRQEYVQKASPITRGDQANQDTWEAVMERRQRGAPILEPADWDAIHSFFEPFLNYFTFQVPMNIYATTAIEIIDPTSKFVSKESRELAKQLGVDIKFEGQKRSPRNFDTLMSVKSDANGHYATIFKDRGGAGREWAKLMKAGQQPQNMLWTADDFYKDVGIKLFGWETK